MLGPELAHQLFNLQATTQGWERAKPERKTELAARLHRVNEDLRELAACADKGGIWKNVEFKANDSGKFWSYVTLNFFADCLTVMSYICLIHWEYLCSSVDGHKFPCQEGGVHVKPWPNLY